MHGSATTKWALRRHFVDRHSQDLISIPGEGVYPQCQECGMQTNPVSLQTTHPRSKYCEMRKARRLQRECAVDSALAMEESFTAYGQELQRVEVFKYLGHLLAHDDNDMRAVRNNMKNARKCWARLSELLRSENLPPRVSGMFYQAVVMAIHLFGSETWNLTLLAMKRLDGFHIRHAYQMVVDNKPRRDPHSKGIPQGLNRAPFTRSKVKENVTDCDCPNDVTSDLDFHFFEEDAARRPQSQWNNPIIIAAVSSFTAIYDQRRRS